jgi:hypothetical protein
MAKNRITELKRQDQNRKWEDLLNHQDQEKNELEMAHIQEYQEFNKNWDM